MPMVTATNFYLIAFIKIDIQIICIYQALTQSNAQSTLTSSQRDAMGIDLELPTSLLQL